MDKQAEKREPVMLKPGAVIQLGEWPNPQWTGALECMVHVAAVMFHMGNMLMTSDKKIRVTIECDPETGRFEAKREELF